MYVNADLPPIMFIELPQRSRTILGARELCWRIFDYFFVFRKNSTTEKSISKHNKSVLHSLNDPFQNPTVNFWLQQITQLSIILFQFRQAKFTRF